MSNEARRVLPTNQYLALINANSPSGTNPVATINDIAGTDVTASTGLLTGGVIFLGTGAGEISITDGSGYIVSNTGTKTSVTWTGITNITPTNIGTQLRTYLAIDSSGTLVEQPGEFTRLQSRTLIVLGLVVHIDGINIFVINNKQHIAYNAMSSTYDLAESIGIFNVSGNVFSDNGASLSIAKSTGEVFRAGSNYEIDVNTPHIKTLTSLTAPTFNYVFNDDSNSGTLSLIDPSSIDDGAGGLIALTNDNKWSVQRIYSFTSNVVAIQRGVEEFDTQTAAVLGIDGEQYFTAPSLKANGLLRGWLVVKKNATDLSDLSQAQFIEAPKFGEGGGASGGSASLVDLQTAYSNSVDPEILTDAIRGAFSIKQGSGLDTDNIIEGLNSSDEVTFEVKADGCIRATTADIVHEAEVSDDHAFEIDANANGFGDVKALFISYITETIGAADDEGVMLVNVDETLSTGGEVFALEVLTTTVGDAKVIGMKTGVGVDIIEQFSGVFGDLTSILNGVTDVTTELSLGGAGNVSAFIADNDTVTLGSTTKFQEIEVILRTVSSVTINPVFEYSTGIGTWATFTPTDGTNGFRNTGEILWDNTNIPSWATGVGTEFLIRITRTRNNVPTTPIIDLMQVVAPDLFNWDKNGNLSVKTLKTSDTPFFDDDIAAGIGGLTQGDIYQTTGAAAAPLNAVGILMIKQ